MLNVLKKIFPVAAILLLTAVAVAVHIPAVSISPTESQVGAEVEFKILVKNQGGDSITNFELVLPETADGKPYYLVKEIGRPVGWDFEDIYKLGSYYPYKISWSTAIGIGDGNSVEFSFRAQVPSATGEYTWTWKTVDIKGDTKTDKITTKAILAPFETFKIAVPKTVKAGEYFQATVTAVDKDGNVKTDFSGSVSFVSSDQMAILPQDYTYIAADKGSKVFTFKLKTAGNQSIIVKSGDRIATSDLFYVKPADTAEIKVSLEKTEVVPRDKVEIKVFAIDVFDNKVDITSKANFNIDKEAGGSFVNNFYEAANLGKWTLVASYISESKTFFDGVKLSVVKEVSKIEEKPAEKRLTISTAESVVAEAGKEVDFSVTVKNTGEADLTNVAVFISEIPEAWKAEVIPTFMNIISGQSQIYTVTISVPADESGVKIINLTAKSLEDVTASKTISLTVAGEGGVTGFFFAILTKPLYIGLTVVVLIVIVLIIWKFIPKWKKKSEE